MLSAADADAAANAVYKQKCWEFFFVWTEISHHLYKALYDRNFQL